MKQNKKVAVALAVAGALSIAGGAFAAGAWFTGATNNSNNITTGQTITMALTDVEAANNNGLYPGDTATITLKADNKGFDSKLTVSLKVGEVDYSQYFDITYTYGEDNGVAYNGGIEIEAAETAQSVTLTFTLDEEADVAAAGKTINVAIALDKA